MVYFWDACKVPVKLLVLFMDILPWKISQNSTKSPVHWSLFLLKLQAVGQKLYQKKTGGENSFFIQHCKQYFSLNSNQSQLRYYLHMNYHNNLLNSIAFSVYYHDTAASPLKIHCYSFNT